MRLMILFCDFQARLLRGNFIVNPTSVYKTHEELWDGEI
jgi:alcohol dehydrogenase (NADP+)